jgi:hypothetical protein
MKIALLALVLLFLSAVPDSDATTFTGPVQIGISCTQQLPINQTASSDLKTFTNNAYICAVFVSSAAAQNVSLVQGTGTTCATSPTALIGATTADSTHGVPVGINGGFVLPVPAGSYIKTTSTAQHLCLLQSSTPLVGGVILYSDSP